MYNKCSTNVRCSSGGMHLFGEREEERKPGNSEKFGKQCPVTYAQGVLRD